MLCSIGKRSVVLKYPDDKETLQSSKTHHARLLGTAHVSSRDSPSCLTFVYQVTGDKSNKLSVFVNNQRIWRSRLPQGHRLAKKGFLFNLFYIHLVELKFN